MNGFNRVLGLVVLGLLACAASAPADTVIFQDGFEGYAASTAWPSYNSNCNPGSPWVVVKNDSDPWGMGRVEVSSVPGGANDAAHGWGAAGPASGDQYLALYSADNHTTFWDINEAWTPLSAANQTALTGQKLLVNTMFYKNSLNGWSGGLGIGGFDSEPGVHANCVFDLYFNDAGNVQYHNGASYVDSGLSFTVDAWHNVLIEADFASQTFKVCIDGGDWSDALDFVNSATTLQSVGLAAQALGRGSFDDFSLTIIPEPSTIALLCVGILSLIAYAWRRRK